MSVLRDDEAVRAWRWDPHFSPDEFRCKHCRKLLVDTKLMDKLAVIRRFLGVPLRVNSGYRCPEYNVLVAKTGPNGPHTRGAVDLAVAGELAYRLVQVAMDNGVSGIGLQQKGSHGTRFVHLDDLDAGPGQPRPWIWTY